MNIDQQIDFAVQKWFEIIKVPHDGPAKDFLLRCDVASVSYNGSNYKYYQRGTGPTVVLVHGLFSNLGSMVPIASDLIQLGYSVVLFDAPAHGEAAGTSTDPLEVRDVIRAIGKRLGNLHAIVCHSLGVLWALAAWNEDFHAKTLISIAGVSSKRYLVDKFVELHQVKPEIADGLIKALEARLGETVWVDLSPAEIVKRIAIPGLIIHGKKDDFVPPIHAEKLGSNWNQARVELIDELGHFDIVGAPRVRTMISDYLKEFA
jgi:pimeloyl-ACP methyl ester carboxylesterase